MMKHYIYGVLFYGGYFYEVDNEIFYSNLKFSWFTLIEKQVTTFLELKRINIKEFYKLWEAARQREYFDNG